MNPLDAGEHAEHLAPARAADTAATNARGWAVVVMLVLFMLINYGDKVVLGLAAQPIMRELGLTPASYGLLSSSFFFLFSASALVMGFVATRVPTKWILFALVVVWGLTQLPVIGATGMGALLVSRIVLGAAEGPAQPLALHAAFRWFPNEKRNIPSAMLVGGGSLGGVVATPLLSSIMLHFGWRAAFLALFLAAVLWCLLWITIGRDGPADPHPHQRRDEPARRAEELRVPYRRIFLSGTWLSGFVAAFGAYWTAALLVAWVPAYVETALGYRTAAAAAIVTAPWLLGLVATFGQGALTQWMMHRGVSSRISRGVLSGSATLLAGVAVLALPTASHPGAQIVLITLAFGLHGIPFATGQTVNGEIAPPAQRSAVLSVSVALVTLAGLAGPYLTGRLVQSSADVSTGYAVAFAVPGILMVIGGLASLFFVRPERDAQRIRLDARKERDARRTSR
ncbi:MFS transporter [Saccharopolyspora rosea]|uniref:MFS transporter n=1 Tax=Saccharopolyspora rosea TaxID=524884 RepID=A0ABW3FWE5_9PSEU